MYSQNKRTRAAPVGAIKASTSRDAILKSDIEAERIHEILTGINRANYDEQLHAEAKRITDAQQEAIHSGSDEDRSRAMASQAAIAASLEIIRRRGEGAWRDSPR